MRLLFLTSDLDVTNGWGRYSAGFLKEARARLGAEAVEAPDPSTLRSARGAFVKPLRLFRDAWRLRTSAACADLIHAATEPVAPLACLLSLMTGTPYLVSVHGTYGDAAAYPRRLRWIYRVAFRRAATIAAVSRYTSEVARRSFGPRRIEVIPGGVEATPSPAHRPAPAAPARILAVGAIKPRKGFHALIDAMALLKEAAVTLDIAGGDAWAEYRKKLDGRVRDAGLGERVRFLGRVSDAELAKLYADADLFVLPSEHDGRAFEGLGLVYLEALARGVPVIGCGESGAEDVIQDGVNGFLVPPGDPAALADAVRKALEPAIWTRLVSASHASVRPFHWDATGAKMAALYQELAKRYAS